jgi:hypothetical protein
MENDVLKKQTQLMDDERRHPLPEQERIRQALRDWWRRGKVVTWTDADKPQMGMMRKPGKVKDQIKDALKSILKGILK